MCIYQFVGNPHFTMIIGRVFKAVGPACVVTLYLLPHTFCIKKYRQFRARYGFNNDELPVQKEIQERFNKVLDDINLSETYRKRITLFNVYDIDVFHAGTVHSKSGGIIGVPANFEYKDINNIRGETIAFEYKKIDWDTQTAKEFKRSLVLSENAQKFALALKVLTLVEYDVRTNAILMGTDMWFAVAIYNTFAPRFFNVIKIVRIASLGAYIAGWYIISFFTSFSLDLYRDERINKQIIGLGSQYIEGGAEYYEKLLNRNKALRALLGARGTHFFTPSGNEPFWRRQRGIPISEQVDLFKLELGNVQLG